MDSAVSPAYLWNDTAGVNHIPLITVKGRITDIKGSKYRGHKFITITEDNCSVSALLKDNVKVDDYVVVKGEPKHSNRREIGSVINLYHAKLITRQSRIENIERDKPRTSLNQFISDGGCFSLLVIGTSKALRDYKAAVYRAGQRLHGLKKKLLLVALRALERLLIITQIRIISKQLHILEEAGRIKIQIFLILQTSWEG